MCGSKEFDFFGDLTDTESTFAPRPSCRKTFRRGYFYPAILRKQAIGGTLLGMAKRLPTIPKKYLGKWIVWNTADTKIIASGRTFSEANRAAKESGEKEPSLMKVHRGRFIGA